VTGWKGTRGREIQVRILTTRSQFGALVLAGSRGPDDPVARQAGVVSKVIVPVAGVPMILRVLSALEASTLVDRITVVGLADEARVHLGVTSGLADRGIQFQPGGRSPADSVALALESFPADRPILITTADHALLTAGVVDWFLASALETRADAVVGFTPYERVVAVAGHTRRTVTRLADNAVCGCNLFALLTPRGRAAVDFFRRIERHRKHPVRIARELGLVTLLKFILRRLALGDAMERLSNLCGARMGAVLLPFGEAAIDVDKPDDLAVAERLLQRDPLRQAPVRGSQS